MNSEENFEEIKRRKLIFLRLILGMINDGATGFDLAYEVENHQEFKPLLYDGILFYNTFIELGNKKFMDQPDKVQVRYTSFMTIEETEKYIFMVWLKDIIKLLGKEIEGKDDYTKFVQAKKEEERGKAEERLRENLTRCLKCGSRIRGKHQIYCEECGVSLLEQIH